MIPKIIPDWVYWIAIALLTAMVGVQQVRVSNGKAELAQEQKARSDETGAREKVAREHSDAIRKLQAQHAVEQQQRETDYETKLAKLENDKRAGDLTAGRLRDKLAAFTASGRRPGESDTIAYERAKNRLDVVGRLLAEGIDLVTESRAVVERRDAEIGRLLDQIRADRKACQADDKGSSTP